MTKKIIYLASIFCTKKLLLLLLIKKSLLIYIYIYINWQFSGTTKGVYLDYRDEFKSNILNQFKIKFCVYFAFYIIINILLNYIKLNILQDHINIKYHELL